MLGRASCPQDPTVILMLCGTNHRLETYEQRDGDETPRGEGYLLVQKSGDYTVTVSAGNPTATAVSVAL